MKIHETVVGVSEKIAETVVGVEFRKSTDKQGGEL